MGLENLKEIFEPIKNDELSNQIANFQAQEPPIKEGGLRDIVPPSFGIDNYNYPISLTDSGGWSSLFRQNHTPRPISDYSGQSRIPFLEGGGRNPNYNPFQPFTLYKNVKRNNLNITPPGQFRRISAFTALDKLISATNIFGDSDGSFTNFFLKGTEPYNVKAIPNSPDEQFKGSRLISMGNRDVPVMHALGNALRVAKFLTSIDGLIFIGKQNLLGNGGDPSGLKSFTGQGKGGQKYKKSYNPFSSIASAYGGGRFGQVSSFDLDKTEPNIFSKLFGNSDTYPDFNPADNPKIEIDPDILLNPGKLAQLLLSPNLPGVGSPLARRMLKFDNTLLRFGPFNDYGLDSKASKKNITKHGSQGKYGPLREADSGFTTPAGALAKYTGSLNVDGWQINNTFMQVDSSTNRTLGDQMTSQSIFTGTSFADIQTNGANVLGTSTPAVIFNKEAEEKKHGAPFYLKDLRDNSYIYFRAYIEGLTENVSPSYAAHNYMGRSEPVYVYERAEREITFTLKLFAQTSNELKIIYEKLNKMTSMCYPEYFEDSSGIYGNRMKPPLAKLRYGDLYGKRDSELMGYIKSLSYNIDQSAPYETKPGKVVPKYIMATLGYQVIHDKVPDINTKFYGINQ